MVEGPDDSMLQLTLGSCLEFLAPDETLGDLLRRAHAEKLVTGVSVLDEVWEP